MSSRCAATDCSVPAPLSPARPRCPCSAVSPAPEPASRRHPDHRTHRQSADPRPALRLEPRALASPRRSRQPGAALRRSRPEPARSRSPDAATNSRSIPTNSGRPRAQPAGRIVVFPGAGSRQELCRKRQTDEYLKRLWGSCWPTRLGKSWCGRDSHLRTDLDDRARCCRSAILRPLESAISRLALIAFLLFVWCARFALRWRQHATSGGCQAFAPKQASLARRSCLRRQHQRLTELRARFRRGAAPVASRGHPLQAGLPRGWTDSLVSMSTGCLGISSLAAASSGKTAALPIAGLNCRSQSKPRAPPAGALNRRPLRLVVQQHAVLVDTPGTISKRPTPTTAQRGMGRIAGAVTQMPCRASRSMARSRCRHRRTADIDEVRAGGLCNATAKAFAIDAGKFDMRVPVYLCFTRMDASDGLRSTFPDLTGTVGRRYGVRHRGSDPATSDVDRFCPQRAFQPLQQRLTDGLRDVLNVEPDPTSRALAFLFPQQFASIEETLDDFLRRYFDPRA